MPDIPNAVDLGLNTVKRECMNCSCIIHYSQVFDHGSVELVPIEEYYGYGNVLNEETGEYERSMVLHQTTRCPDHAGLSLQDLHAAIYLEDQILMRTMNEMIERLPAEEKIAIVDPDTHDFQGYKMRVIPSFSFDSNRNLVVMHDASSQVKSEVKNAVDNEFGEGKLVFL